MAKPLGILLISGGHERAHYALVLATGAAALLAAGAAPADDMLSAGRASTEIRESG